MAREQFSFFESYYRSFKSLPPEVVGQVVQAMGSYFFENEEAELDGLSKSVFELIKPVLNNAIKLSDRGAKGGAPKGNQNASKQQKNNLKQLKNNIETTNGQHKTSDKDKDKDKEKDNNNIPPYNPPRGKEVYFPNDETLNKAFSDYVDHRKQIKKPMSSRAVELAIEKLNKLSGGDTDKAIRIINQSIGQGWQGLFELKENKAEKKVQDIDDFWRRAT